MPNGGQAGARATYHHGDLKRTLVEAALVLVAEKGPRGFTLTEAARRAGVSAAAPYRHFADKGELLAAVAEQGFRNLSAAIEAGARGAADPYEAIVVMARSYVEWAVANPDHYRVMFSSGTEKSRYPALKVAGDATFDGLIDGITRCQRAGLLAGDDPKELAGPMWSLVHGVATLTMDGDFTQAGLVEPAGDLAVRAAHTLLASVRT